VGGDQRCSSSALAFLFDLDEDPRCLWATLSLLGEGRCRSVGRSTRWEALSQWAAISPLDGGEGEIWEMGGNFGQVLSKSRASRPVFPLLFFFFFFF
jgi:hypothetical protein